MKNAFILTWCLLALCGIFFGQATEVALPAGLVANQASSVSVGADGETYIFIPGKAGNGTIYQVNAKRITSVTGYMLSVPSPQGPQNLFGTTWNNLTTTLQVVSDGTIKTFCSTYTVDGKTGTLTSHLPYGPFPSYDGTYLYAGNDAVGKNTISTIFQLIGHNTTTCDLHKVVGGINGETMRVVKQPGNKFLVDSMLAGGDSPVIEVGIMESNGSYTSLVGTSSSQIASHRCCTFAPMWGTSQTFVTYNSTDNKNVGAVVDEKGITEVFNSSSAGNLLVDMWVNDFRGDVAVLGGSNRTVGAVDELVAFNVTTKVLTVVGAYNVDNIPGIHPFFFFLGSDATVGLDGTIWFEAYQIVDKTNHLYRYTTPGPPVVTRFAADKPTIVVGDSTPLTWNVTGQVNSVTLTGYGVPAGTFVQPVGSYVVSHTLGATTYTITAIGSSGFDVKTTTVTVTQKPVTPPEIKADTTIFGGKVTLKAAPGQIVTLWGSLCGNVPADTPWFPLQTAVAGCSVKFADLQGNTTLGNLYYVSAGQINVQVPSTIALGANQMTVTYNGLSSSPLFFQVVSTNPDYVMQTVGSQNYLKGVHEDGSYTTASNPAKGGELILIFLSGLGNGTKITIDVNGVPATVYYAGPQGDYAGLDQINVRIPNVQYATEFRIVATATDGTQSVNTLLTEPVL